MKMETINDRFKIIVERWYNGNDLAFAKSMGKFSSSFSKIINGTVSPRAATLQEVCRTIPELNPAWLLMGEGKMTREPIAPDANRIDDMEKVVASQQSELALKTELIDSLKQHIADLRRQLGYA